MYWIDIVDHFITHYGLVVIGLLECFLIGWVFKADKLRSHINQASGKKLSGYWDICIKFITPMVLIILLAYDLWTELTVPYGKYAIPAIIKIGVLWFLMTFAVSFIWARTPWAKNEV